MMGIFQAGESDYSCWDKVHMAAFWPRIAEKDDLPTGISSYVRVFVGEANQFKDLSGRNQQLLDEFASIIKPRWRKLAEANRGFVIGVNVRRGKDFRDPTTEEDFLRFGMLRTPLRWFIDSLRFVRSILGQQTTALVVSDGTAHDLAEMLQEEPITLLRPGSAASDLYSLAGSRVLIGSGGSSFSAWASYFAQCPTITIRGQSLRWFALDHGASTFVGDFYPDDPPPLFVENLRKLKWEMTGNR
jgi:hypothetical protein